MMTLELTIDEVELLNRILLIGHAALSRYQEFEIQNLRIKFASYLDSPYSKSSRISFITSKGREEMANEQAAKSMVPYSPPKVKTETFTPIFVDLLRTAVNGPLKHGPGGSGREGPCDKDCLKCDIEKVLKLFHRADAKTFSFSAYAGLGVQETSRELQPPPDYMGGRQDPTMRTDDIPKRPGGAALQHVSTVTGHLTAKTPSVQEIKRKFEEQRPTIQPADYSQLELRVMASLGGFEQWEADPHLAAVRKMFFDNWPLAKEMLMHDPTDFQKPLLNADDTRKMITALLGQFWSLSEEHKQSFADSLPRSARATLLRMVNEYERGDVSKLDLRKVSIISAGLVRFIKDSVRSTLGRNIIFHVGPQVIQRVEIGKAMVFLTDGSESPMGGQGLMLGIEQGKPTRGLPQFSTSQIRLLHEILNVSRMETGYPTPYTLNNRMAFAMSIVPTEFVEEGPPLADPMMVACDVTGFLVLRPGLEETPSGDVPSGKPMCLSYAWVCQQDRRKGVFTRMMTEARKRWDIVYADMPEEQQELVGGMLRRWPGMTQVKIGR
jgi:hypothetical protein